jgi:predicted nucleotide-binding protein
MDQWLSEEGALRTRFLCVTWHAANRQEKTGVNQFHVGEALELDRPAIGSITDYLVGEKFIQHASMGGNVWLGHAGRVGAEERMAEASHDFRLSVAVEGQIVKGLRLGELSVPYEALEEKVRLWEDENRTILGDAADPSLRQLYGKARAPTDLGDCINKGTTELKMVRQRLARAASSPTSTTSTESDQAHDAGSTDPRAVFVVHGRDLAIRDAMFDLLLKLRLDPIPWEEAVQMTGDPAAHTSAVIESGLARARAVVVLLTPDDVGRMKPEFLNDDDEEWERELTGQPRLNVVFEAGRASATHPKRTILVQVGQVRRFSDISGQQILHFSGSPQDRNKLANRLKLAGCEINQHGDWMEDHGEFRLAVS